MKVCLWGGCWWSPAAFRPKSLQVSFVDNIFAPRLTHQRVWGTQDGASATLQILGFFTPLLLGYYISEHVAKKKMVTAQENYKGCVHGLWRAVGVDMLKETINEFMNLKRSHPWIHLMTIRRDCSGRRFLLMFYLLWRMSGSRFKVCLCLR